MKKKIIYITVSDKYAPLIDKVEKLALAKGKNKVVPTLMELLNLGIIAQKNGLNLLNGSLNIKLNEHDLINLK